MRILTNDDVAQVLTMAECMSALEVAYREGAQGLGDSRPRNHSYRPMEAEGFDDLQFRFKSQEGGNVSSGVWAMRITSELIGSETIGTVKRRRAIPAATGDKYCGLITLYSMRHLEPVAIIHDSVIQRMRCSATSALGIRALSREDVRLAGLFGTGWQATSHLQGMLHVRPSIEEVRVYSPVEADREAFARRWSEATGKRIVAVSEPRRAVEDCGIVTCATNTFRPCFDGAWLEPGTHVTSITHPDSTVLRRELDDVAFDRADRLIVLAREQIHHDNQVDILGSINRGVRSMDEIGELGELLAGACTGRRHADEITIFANNTGTGMQFAAVGARVLALAEAKGLGRELPVDWFLEDTPP